MKKLSDFLKNNLRIIEFNSKNSFFPNQSIKTDKFLSIIKNGDCKESTTVCLSEENFLQTVKKNSSDAIIMNCTGWNELRSLQNTAEAKYLIERITVLNIIPAIYFLVKGWLSKRKNFYGLFYLNRGIKLSLYIGLKSRRKKKSVARHYLSPLVGVENFFQELNKKNISYCILRWFNELPHIEENEDIDILVEDNDLTKVYSLIDRYPGIIPFDIYSKTGIPGSDFKSLPYWLSPILFF